MTEEMNCMNQKVVFGKKRRTGKLRQRNDKSDDEDEESDAPVHSKLEQVRNEQMHRKR